MGCNKLYNFLSMFFVFGIILFLLFYFLISINFVIGEVQVGAGNNSGDIDSVYAPSQAIRGWINISLINEPSDSLLTAFNSSIKILNFLKNNLVNQYNCTPRDCSDNYDISNGESSKSFFIKRGESKIIGLKLTGKLSDTPINSNDVVSFKFESNASETCIEPLRIDITDDDVIDWIPINSSGNYDCYNNAYWGCYNKNVNLTQRDLSTSNYYCEKIRVQKSPSLKIGAYINVDGDNNPDSPMSMKVLDVDLQEIPGGGCTIQGITGSSEVSCTVNVGLMQDTDIYVCIKANSDNNYKIDAENQQPTCGFYDIENHDDLSWDYSIFAEGEKYAAIGSFVFDDTALRNYDANDNEKLYSYFNDYLDLKYNRKCENGCVIPIRFIAGVDQQITLSNLLLKYNTDSGVMTESNFYSVNKNSAKLNSGFLKLDLEKANLSVPSDIKNDTAVIKIGSKEILIENIQVKAVPIIKNLMPLNPPASVPVTFSVVMERAEANMSFNWNFGDNSSQETSNENSIKHTYAAIGTYRLTVKAVGKSGEFSKSFDINVVSPKSLINKTISDYENDIKNTEIQISQLPEWIKSEVEKKINLTDIEGSISMQKRKYESGIDDATAVLIMRALLNLKVPTSIFTSMEVQPSVFLMKKEAIDIDLLSELGAGNTSSIKNDYYKRMISWIRDNLNVSVESKIYSVSFRDRNDEVLFSDVKMNINPIGKIKELYFVINGDPEKIKFNGDFRTKEKTNSVSITLDDMEGSKTIEFLHPEAIDILSLPLYISPEFKYLPMILDTNECNLNGKCESKSGENYGNCSDCHEPWFAEAFFWIMILLVFAFIAYILLQEWYKRYYESSLFKDKNTLFNLINYINNSELHGVSRVEIYKQLRGMNWKDEQIEYAWNKLHGLRTGMWEIPLFKVFENIRIKDELRRRQQIGEKISPATPSKVPTGFQPRNPQRIPPKNQPSFTRNRFKRL